LRKLFELEVPEIFAGTVEIKAIAREAGARSKIAVISNEEGIDPIGSCVGQKGTRVQAVIDEVNGEKIDIIEWSDDVEKLIASALSPAKVVKVDIKEESKEAVAFVVKDQLSLAIGKKGQNVRLAAKLTGWKIDVETVEGDEDESEESMESSSEKKQEDKKQEKEGMKVEKKQKDETEEGEKKDDKKAEKAKAEAEESEKKESKKAVKAEEKEDKKTKKEKK
jgi:N utilization substance protein A